MRVANSHGSFVPRRPGTIVNQSGTKGTSIIIITVGSVISFPGQIGGSGMKSHSNHDRMNPWKKDMAST